MKGLIIGMGEVGKALYAVLKDTHEIHTKDLDNAKIPARVDVMHVCLRYSGDFKRIVDRYASECHPDIIDICTTVPPGTTERIYGACHSTTRGLHPNLETSLRTFVKHIGGEQAYELAKYYNEAGIKTKIHATAKTTEIAHILSNSVYGINVIFAQEMADLCRDYGVDYTEAVVAYNQTSNDGYLKLGHPSKMRMILTPPGKKIGGHCVTQNANLIPQEKRGTLLGMLAGYGK